MAESVKHAPPNNDNTSDPRTTFQISEDGGVLEIRNYGEIVKESLRVGRDLPILSRLVQGATTRFAPMLAEDVQWLRIPHWRGAGAQRCAVLVDEQVDVRQVASDIMSAKLANAGEPSIAPPCKRSDRRSASA
eukprot:8504982-Pyramimonas_sp.AAC.1